MQSGPALFFVFRSVNAFRTTSTVVPYGEVVLSTVCIVVIPQTGIGPVALGLNTLAKKLWPIPHHHTLTWETPHGLLGQA
jgi:hypothetical protein